MIEERFERLMWESIDRSITSEDQVDLDAYLAAHPEARVHFQGLVEMSGLLGGIHEVEPPPQLRHRVHASIDASRVTYGRPATTRRWFAIRPYMRYAAVAAAGFVVGIIGYHLVSYDRIANPHVDLSRFYGTISREPSRPSVPGVALDLPEGKGQVNFRREGSLVLSDIDITSDIGIRLEFEYLGACVPFGGMASAADAASSVKLARHGATVTSEGAGHYNLVFRTEDAAKSPVRVRVLSGDRVILEKTVFPDNKARNL